MKRSQNVNVLLPPIEIQKEIGNKIKKAAYLQAEVRKNIKNTKEGIRELI